MNAPTKKNWQLSPCEECQNGSVSVRREVPGGVRHFSAACDECNGRGTHKEKCDCDACLALNGVGPECLKCGEQCSPDEPLCGKCEEDERVAELRADAYKHDTYDRARDAGGER